MRHRYYSYANSAAGRTNPDEISVFEVDCGDDCGVRGCIGALGTTHTVISWHGGEYSRENAWIAADDAALLDLENAR